MTNAGATGPNQFGSKLYLSNHSYGFPNGWSRSSGQWRWLGNRTDAKMDVPLAPVLTPQDNVAAYDAANQIENGGDNTFGFDDAGRQTSKTTAGVTNTYTFNTDDRLTEVSNETSTYLYRYNGVGERLSKTVDGVETRYVLDLSGDMSRVLCDTDNAGNVSAYYVHGAGLLYKVTSSGERIHFHYDPIGNTVALTDTSESITDKYAYDAFGKLVYSEGISENPYKYVGQFGVMEEGNGLLFMRARFYDPETKKFLSRDPIKGEVDISQSLNQYTYVNSNPILYMDPKGTIKQEKGEMLMFIFHTAEGTYEGAVGIAHIGLQHMSPLSLVGVFLQVPGAVYGFLEGFNADYGTAPWYFHGGGYVVGNIVGNYLGRGTRFVLTGNQHKIGKWRNILDNPAPWLVANMVNTPKEEYIKDCYPSQKINLEILKQMAVANKVSPKTILLGINLGTIDVNTSNALFQE
jgi:RHS repeat-associated protein